MGMIHRRIAAASGMTIAALLGAVPASAQQDWSAVEFEATHLSGNVFVLISGAGGNIGVSSGPDGTLLVDDQFAPLAEKIRAALAGLGRSSRESEPRFILNTHWHGDHTGGNAEFGDVSTIIAHTNVRGRLAAAREDGEADMTAEDAAAALPVITFDESLSVHFNGEEIRAFHIPNGHTDGDAAVYFTGSGVLHMGDDFFAGRFPYVDLGSGGSVEGLERGVAEVLQHIPDDTIVIPGHGPVSTVSDLEVYHRMLVETIAMVREKRDAGIDLDRIQADGVSERWAGWGEGEVFIDTDRWLETIYNSLSGSGNEYLEHGHEHRDDG